MAIALTILSLCTLVTIFHTRDSSALRDSVVKGTIVWGTIIVLLTEGASLFHTLDSTTLATTWGIILAAGIGVWFVQQRRNGFNLPRLPSFDLAEWLIVICLAVILGVLTITAFVFPPSTWDAMTYHLSRVMHWVQNETVAFYPTAILRQLHQAPGAEYILLHFQLLSGGDWFANSVQLLAYVGSILCVTLIARELGADRRAQLLSGLFTATLPTALLEATSTQNDLVVTFWSLCFVLMSLRLITRWQLEDGLLAGLSLGLALVSKALAYLYLFPFGLLLAFLLLRQYKAGAVLRLVMMLSLAFALNLGYFARNTAFYGSPLGPGREVDAGSYVNEAFTPAIMVSNLVRNGALQLRTPFDPVNRSLTTLIVRAFDLVNLDPSDSRSTWDADRAYPGFTVSRSAVHEDLSANSGHFLLLTGTLAACLLSKAKTKPQAGYLAAVIVSVLLFSLILKWQPWNGRLHLAYFSLLAPFVGLSLSRLRRQVHLAALIVALLATSVPAMVHNELKPLTTGTLASAVADRELWYYEANTDIRHGYMTAASELAQIGCTNVGVILANNDYEYPLWQNLQAYQSDVVRLEHVNVQNASAGLRPGSGESQPICAIFVRGEHLQPKLYVGSNAYRLYWQDEAGINLYR